MADVPHSDADGDLDEGRSNDLSRKLRAAEFDALGVSGVTTCQILGFSASHLSRLRNSDPEYIAHRESVAADIMGKASGSATYALNVAFGVVIEMATDPNQPASIRLEAAKAILGFKIPAVSGTGGEELGSILDALRGVKR